HRNRDRRVYRAFDSSPSTSIWVCFHPILYITCKSPNRSSKADSNPIPPHQTKECADTPALRRHRPGILHRALPPATIPRSCCVWEHHLPLPEFWSCILLVQRQFYCKLCTARGVIGCTYFTSMALND